MPNRRWDGQGARPTILRGIIVFKFSVVICAYTEARWTELVTSVESLRVQRLAPYETILVIDHNPTLLNRARETFNDVVIVENVHERGLSGARNSGIAMAGGDIIAFMDEDAAADPEWLLQLARHYRNPQVWGAGGAILPSWAAGRPAWFPAEFDWVVGCSYRGLPEEATPVRNLIGCNMSFRREVFAAAGLFRSGIGRIDKLPAGCEETELCIRTRQCEPLCQLIYEPAARVYHHVPAERAHWRYFLSRCYHEGRSKALVVSLLGARDGLSTERNYTWRTLPRGVWRGLRDTFLGRDVSGLGRATAIISGLVTTTVGYLLGQLYWRTTVLLQSKATTA